MTAGHGIKNPISYAEDQIIRQLALDGYPPVLIHAELSNRGYARSRDTVRLYMWRQKIYVDPIKAQAKRSDMLAAAGASGKAARWVRHTITPQESNDLFAAAFAAGSGGSKYQDKPRAALLSEHNGLRPVRPTASNHMTLGGVAAYA